ncbi:MAG: hypothetical protein H7222_06460 [Methylotenera sp.]|nr:hypothetical protein [Oligoflexia bacterium]
MKISKLSRFAFLSLAFTLLLPQRAFCFPEMIRHSYVNCTACHVSPSGGGLLTEYGRALSLEALSMNGTEKESKFAYGLLELPTWLNAGGDIRALQYDHNTPRVREGQFIRMQADLEAEVKVNKLSVVGTLGADQKYPDRIWASEFISRRHYLLYHLNEENYVRVGKFKRPYGINTDNHSLYVRKDLGWNAGSETYNAEYSFLGDPWNGQIAMIFGRPDDDSIHSESGFSGTVAYALSPKSKLGFSNFYGRQSTQPGQKNDKREVVGPYLLLGITDKFYVLSELDYQRRYTANTNGLLTYTQVGYEIIKGLHFYGIQELSRLDFAQSQSLKNAYTVGTRFFPRPHLDLNLAYQIQTRKALAPDGQDQLLYFIAHFYL